MSYWRTVRWPWLAFIMAAHVAFIAVCFKAVGPRERAASSAVSARSVLFIDFIFPKQPAKPPVTVAPAITHTKPLSPAFPVAARQPTIQAEQPVAALPADAGTVTAAPGAAGLDLDLRQIGKDLQAPQRTLPFAPKAALAPIATLADKIAAAAVPGEISYKTFTTADGTRITKVTSPGGTYCVIAPNHAGGATVVQRDASANRVVNCGNY